MTPSENTRGGSRASSPGRSDDGGVNAQEVSAIDRIDQLRDMGAIRSSTRPSRRVVDNRGGDRVIKGSIRARLLISLAAIAVIATACSTSGTSSAPSAAASVAASAAASAATSAAASSAASGAPSAAAKQYKI